MNSDHKQQIKPQYISCRSNSVWCFYSLNCCSIHNVQQHGGCVNVCQCAWQDHREPELQCSEREQGVITVYWLQINFLLTSGENNCVCMCVSVWANACVFICNHVAIDWCRCSSPSVSHSLRQTETQQCSLLTARRCKHLLAVWPSSHGARDLNTVQSPSNYPRSHTLYCFISLTFSLISS